MKLKLSKKGWKRIAQESNIDDAVEKFLDQIQEKYFRDVNRHMDQFTSPELELEISIDEILWNPVNSLVESYYNRAWNFDDLDRYKASMMELIEEASDDKNLSDDFWERNSGEIETLVEDLAEYIFPEEMERV